MSLELAIIRPGSPGDVGDLQSFLETLPVGRILRLGIFGKVEGPATLNDYSRHLAQSAMQNAVVRARGQELLERTWGLFSTGCEGIASPVILVLVEIEDGHEHGNDGLVFGGARSSPLPPHKRCGRDHIAIVAQTVREAVASAGLTADQVRLVFVKSPVLSPDHALGAGLLARHAGSTDAARGAGGIGAGLALGDIAPDELDDDPVGRSSAYAMRTIAFSGTETDCVEASVLGERPGGDSRWTVRTAHMQDILDIPEFSELSDGIAEFIFFKAGIPPSGFLRGNRTTVFTSDLPSDKQLRAAASGVLGARFGTTPAFISAGSEHQGPPGSSLCSVLFRKA